MFQEALRLWLDGATYKAIGQQLGVSRQRVQQILRPPKAIYDLVLQQAQSRCQDCGIYTKRGHVHPENHDDAENFNDLANLVYLCPSCHRQRHIAYWDKPRQEKGGGK